MCYDNANQLCGTTDYDCSAEYKYKMELIHVKGNTYYIDAWEAIPVYIKENKECILLDSGWDYEQDEVDEVLIRHGLRLVGIIGSHLHTDHSGNLNFFQKKYGIPVALPAGEAALGYNAMTLKAYLYIFTPKDVEAISAVRALQVKPDIWIAPDADHIEMAGVTFGIMRTAGHSPDHVAIRTPDVLYVGDALMTEETMAAAKAPYYASVAQALETMEALSEVSGPALVAHKGYCKEISHLAEYNIRRVKELAEMYASFVTEKMTLEDILAKACQELKLLSKQPYKVKLYERDIRSFIEYLADCGMIKEHCENGRLYYLPV